MIQINKITPQGYCNGVKKALTITEKALMDSSTLQPIYLLGNIIHNRHVVDGFQKLGAILIEDKTKTRLELLDRIPSGSVVFSAHGVSPLVYEKAKEKGLNIIDATCGNVQIIHKRIQKYLSLGYDCIYIGTNNHPECEGVLGISSSIHFVCSPKDAIKLNISNEHIYVTNQTTLSKYDIQDIFDILKTKYPTCIIDDKICNATTIRQEAMAKQPKVDLCIVVGDPSSSNTKKLVKVSQEIAGIKTILCEDEHHLDMEVLKGIQSVSISSGASTPEYIVEAVINKIKRLL